MDLETLTAIRQELDAELIGRRLGKIFQLSRFDIAIDFRLDDSRYLFVSVEPARPRLYLIRRRLKELEKGSGNPSPFSLAFRKHLSDGELVLLEQLPHERVLRFDFRTEDETGSLGSASFIVQLTGTSANLFLLDSESIIVAMARSNEGDGQRIGDRYSPPVRRTDQPIGTDMHTVALKAGTSISTELDEASQALESERRFQSLVTSARSKIRNEISRRRKLVQKMQGDLAGHGDAEKWKRFGDLLLANVGTAVRSGSDVRVTDYFDDAAGEISIEIDENDSIPGAAEKFFKRYTRARNAQREIESRLKIVSGELEVLEARQAELEDLIAVRDVDAIIEIAGSRKPVETRLKNKRSVAPTGTRAFRSSDGFEILVGKKSKDNDTLTFRIAKSLDTWMHAADYPGSHVVIRNPDRKEIPHTTLLEAAQIAAFYSQGKTQPKAAVHYTQKKFVNKPRGAAPGLVSLSSFKTILVVPKIDGATLKES